jgi:DNA-directed RNA polymerase subunit N (RpoN/RPB10)
MKTEDLEKRECSKCGQLITEKQQPQKEKYTNALTEIRTIFDKYGFDSHEAKRVLDAAKTIWH